MREHYDIIIVGMGPSGIFCAYELSKIMPAAKILMIEKGKRIEERNCFKKELSLPPIYKFSDEPLRLQEDL